MPANVRDLVGDIREAVERLPKEALVDILVYVFKEYVVEGPAPLAGGTPIAHDEFDGRTFADVIRALQQRLDLPELELFDVQGDRVQVRVGGRSVPLDSATSRPSPVPEPGAGVAGTVASSGQRGAANPVTAAPLTTGRAVTPAAPPTNTGPGAGAASSSGASPASQPAPPVSPASPPSKGLLEID